MIQGENVTTLRSRLNELENLETERDILLAGARHLVLHYDGENYDDFVALTLDAVIAKNHAIQTVMNQLSDQIMALTEQGQRA